MKKRIILLTQWFEPEPTFKGLLFARELVSRGYDVRVVTGFPNYPGGKLYPGYRLALFRREVVDGIRVVRLPLFPSHDDSGFRRALTYITFAISAGLYCLFSATSEDTIYVYQLLTLGAVAAVVKATRRSRVVLDVTDIWPETLAATGMVNSARLLGAVGRFARWVYRHADAVVASSPGFRRLLIERGVPPERAHLIYNWCNESALATREPADALGHGEMFNIVFAGNLGRAQGLMTVLDAAERLATDASDVRFVLMGTGLERDDLSVSARERGLTNVDFLPHVSIDRVGSYLDRADALLVHLKADPLFSITIPGKTQAYMAMGKPVLMAVSGDAANLVRDAQCGVDALPESAESIANAARYLASLPSTELSAMGRRGQAFYREHLSIAAGVTKFVAVFEQVREQ